MHLKRDSELTPHYQEFAARVRRYINKVKPTHVLISGINAARYLLPRIEHIDYKYGWVFDYDFGKVTCKVTPTLDLEPLYSTKLEDDTDTAEADEQFNDVNGAGDLLYFVTRNITNLYAGKHLYSLAHIKPNPVYIDSLAKYQEILLPLFKEKSTIAVDCETASLESYNNSIYMIQFAFDTKASYVIPLWHPKSPLSTDEARSIQNNLKRLFGTLKYGSKRFITKNGKFDLRIFRAQWKIRFIPHDLIEIDAGEHLLDDNMSLFAKFRMHGKKLKPQGNLLAQFASYNNDWYLTAPFSKDERNMTGSVPPDDPNLLNYCAADVSSIYGVYKQQLRRAACIKVLDPKTQKPTSYLPFFKNHLIKQMGATQMVLSTLEENGSYVDVEYMMYLLGQNSPLKKILSDVQRESEANKRIQKVNSKLAETQGIHSKGLFNREPFVFSWTKDDAKRLLFIDLMGLKTPKLTKKTQLPSLDKFFIAKYEKEIPEVALFGRFQRASKLLSTYVRGWYKKIRSGADSSIDSKLRASYDFFRVVTGRLASFDPNLQQVPSRGELVKIIKRMFVAKKGYLSIRFDYSAHEVRLWSIIAVDTVLAEAFKVGMELRKEWIQNPTPEIMEALKKKGDLHIQNVHRFFGIWIEKNNPLRDAVKSVIFGILYGKSVKTLAKNINDTVEKAQQIMDKMYGEFKVGAQYLRSVSAQIANNGTVMSPIGRRRNVYRVFTGIRSFVASAERRAKNAPIQGMAAEVGMQTAHLILKECDQFLTEHELDDSHWPLITRTVHDAMYYEVPYQFVIPFIHIMQHVASAGVAEYFKNEFNWEFTVDPEIEIEFSAREDHSFKWDWALPQLTQHIEACVKDQVEMTILKEEEKADVLEQIFAPWRDKELRKELCTKYPLLGVPNLHKQIRGALPELVE
jgi:DNA polymerase I-like protein with 3'-5' exonuclease and polymerase domains